MNDTVINLQDFKDGVADALLLGISADVYVTSAYKQGYDFGMVLHSDLVAQEEKYLDERIAKLNKLLDKKYTESGLGKVDRGDINYE